MARNSYNLQALVDSLREALPGIVVYTWPDSAHMDRRSDHNWDDGSLLTEQTDSDNEQELRAADAMLGPHFTKAQAYAVVSYLITVNRKRVYYVIFDGHIWHCKRGFKKEVFTGADKHTDHIHTSTLAAEDDTRDPWILSEGKDVALEGKDLQKVTAINTRIENTVAMKDRHPIDWDDVTGNTEENSLVQAVKRIDKNAAKAAEPTEATLTDAQMETLIVRVSQAILDGLKNGSFRFEEDE